LICRFISEIKYFLVVTPIFFFAETVTINTRKEVQHSESLNSDINRYSVLQSNPLIGINNMTHLDSQQTTASDMVHFAVVLTTPSEDKLHSSSLQPSDGFKYSPAQSPNKTSEIPFISNNNGEHSNSTEGMPLSSSPPNLNDKKSSFVYSSNISELSLASKDTIIFNITEPETSFEMSSSSESDGKKYASQVGRSLGYTSPPNLHEQTTKPSSTSGSQINTGVQNSTLQRNYVHNISSLKTEGATNLPNTPTTQTIQLTPVSQVDSYSSPHTSQINDTTSDSANKNTSSFSVDAIKAASESKNGIHYTKSEGKQHTAVSSMHSFQQLNNSTLPDSEPNTGTDDLMISNGNQHNSVSEQVNNPLPTSSIPNKNIKPLSGEELEIISLPTYHPNDVIHISSSEMYPSDGIRNTSQEEKHPCARTCKDDSPPMVCQYKFELEWYYSMSKACYNCPLSLDDCNRKDCVVADGIRRPIVVVNRQMPGPSIEVSLLAHD
jgi:hypothetical protein